VTALAFSPGGETLASAGAKRFVENACNTCHGDHPGARGPSLTGLFGRAVRLQSGQTVVADEVVN
jgi:cytochrome c2